MLIRHRSLRRVETLLSAGVSRSTPLVAPLAVRGIDEVLTGFRVVRKPFAQLKVMEHGDKRNAVIPCYR